MAPRSFYIGCWSFETYSLTYKHATYKTLPSEQPLLRGVQDAQHDAKQCCQALTKLVLHLSAVSAARETSKAAMVLVQTLEEELQKTRIHVERHQNLG